MLEKLFKLTQNKTSVKSEVVAGITTFMTMAYILAVNRRFFRKPEWIKMHFLRRQLWLPLSLHW